MDIAFDAVSVALRGRLVLNRMSGVLRHGRVTAILGPNGAGKSTLLSCLTGLRRPDSGQITLGARAIASLDRRERGRTIGLLPQHGDVHWDVSVQTLVALGRFPHRGGWGESAHDAAAVTAAMAATDCTHLAERTVQRLSGGEQGRVLLARVLAGEPDWLLADEPLAGLDPAHQLDVLDRLKSVALNGAGVAIVLHDLTQTARIADDVIILNAGTVVAAGPRETALTKENIATAYGVDVHIGETSSGAPLIVPTCRLA